MTLTLYPSFFKSPTAVIFADAPIGVIFPPNVAPDSKPKYKRYGSIPSEAVTAVSTGSIVATYGILSTNAEISTDPHTRSSFFRDLFRRLEQLVNK